MYHWQMSCMVYIMNIHVCSMLWLPKFIESSQEKLVCCRFQRELKCVLWLIIMDYRLSTLIKRCSYSHSGILAIPLLLVLYHALPVLEALTDCLPAGWVIKEVLCWETVLVSFTQRGLQVSLHTRCVCRSSNLDMYCQCSVSLCWC